MEQNKHGTIEQIKAVWNRWDQSVDPLFDTGYAIDAPTAMVEIGAILKEHENREKRLKAISDAARKEREARDESNLRSAPSRDIR